MSMRLKRAIARATTAKQAVGLVAKADYPVGSTVLYRRVYQGPTYDGEVIDHGSWGEIRVRAPSGKVYWIDPGNVEPC